MGTNHSHDFKGVSDLLLGYNLGFVESNMLGDDVGSLNRTDSN